MSGTHDQRTSVAAVEPITQTPRPRQPKSWCHYCRREIVPLMVPDPTCPDCNEQFVEEIEDDNDPRIFPHLENDDDEWQPLTSTPGGDSEPTSPLTGAHEIIDPHIFSFLEMLVQQIAGPSVRSEAVGGRLRTTNIGAQGEAEPPRHPSFQLPSLGMLFSAGTQEAGQQTPNQPNQPNQPQQSQHPAAPLMPPLLSLLQHLESFDGPHAGNFFSMNGNPSDYVWSQAGLDNIVTQLMEHAQARNAPPPAPENIINSLPTHNITEEEIGKDHECIVCKDEFVLNEEAVTLLCTHTFHDVCIRPWLKVNGTCPVCRYSLVNNTGNAGTTTFPTNQNFPGTFPPNVTPSSGYNGERMWDDMDERLD